MPLILGRLGIAIGLSLFVLWLAHDALTRKFSRPWKAFLILGMLASFAGLAWWALAVIARPPLAAATPWLYLAVGLPTFGVGVAVWVPTVRAWLARRRGA